MVFVVLYSDDPIIFGSNESPGYLQHWSTIQCIFNSISAKVAIYNNDSSIGDKKGSPTWKLIKMTRSLEQERHRDLGHDARGLGPWLTRRKTRHRGGGT